MSNAAHSAARIAWEKGAAWLQYLQTARGCWMGEVKWNTLLASQYVMVSHIIGQPVNPEQRAHLIKYFRSHQTPSGGWGMHQESEPYVFMTALAYVALRLLGAGPEERDVQRARHWLKTHGGVLPIPTWGKFWLSLLGLYRWEGLNPILPELWLLPRWTPIHPRRFYNHTRLIYLGMAYLYARRFVAPIAPLTHELRSELYDHPYERIDFRRWRNVIAPTDRYAAPGLFLRAANRVLGAYEKRPLPGLRARALDECFGRIVHEVQTTHFASISPVNGLLNILALFDRKHPDLCAAYDGINYWRWEDEQRGLRFAGAHSHTWDTSFAIQALTSGPEPAGTAHLESAHAFLCNTQITAELPDHQRWYRDRKLGGWCFSDDHHQWPVSDCTAEALRAILLIEKKKSGTKHLSEFGFRSAVDFILSRQNSDGGFGSFEKRRGSTILEAINPSEMFGNCMVEGSYVECTSSCVAALVAARRHDPGFQPGLIDHAIARGITLILRKQNADGSWPGLWGINFTYGTFFCVEALREAGITPEHPAIESACRWLISKQRPDGGWGEHWTSAREDRYIEHTESQVIMTSWALLALQAGEFRDQTAIERGILWLSSRQDSNGDFPEQSVAGVFFRTGMLHYSLYKNYFPVWALGRFLSAGSRDWALQI